MDPYVSFKLFLLFCLFIISGFFASSEASFFSLTPLHLHKMRAEHSRRLPLVQQLLEYPRRLIITIIIGSESVNVVISALTTAIFIHFFGNEGRWAAIVVLTPLLLVFCEAAPKTVAKIYPIPISQRVAPVLRVFSRAAFPVIWLLDRLSGWLTEPFKPRKRAGDGALTEEELRVLVDVGHEEGVLEKEHRDLIHRVFELGDIAVEDIMTPRIDMFSLPDSLEPGELKREILKSGYSRVPVYGTDRDDILGVLYAKDLLHALAQGTKDLTVKALLRKTYFIPLENRADSLLRDFQVRKIHAAIVVDEYGGVAGLVTMEDILESLFGDIYDERDTIEKLYRIIDPRTIVASGRIRVEDFNAIAGTSIPAEDFDTLGGFAFHLFGRLPAKGDEVRFDGWTFQVERMRGARIWRVRVIRDEGERDG